MFTNRLEDLWKTAAHDGASCPVGPRADDELDEILEAWFLERSRSIESSLLLDQSRRLLKRVIAGGPISDAERREARGLLRAINRAGRC